MDDCSIEEIVNQIHQRQLLIVENYQRIERITNANKTADNDRYKINIQSRDAVQERIDFHESIIADFKEKAHQKFKRIILNAPIYSEYMRQRFPWNYTEEQHIQHLNAEEELEKILREEPTLFSVFVTRVLMSTTTSDLKEFLRPILDSHLHFIVPKRLPKKLK
jgi:hypothetical protein